MDPIGEPSKPEPSQVHLPALANAPTPKPLGVAGRPSSGFLAHLIATSAQLPQARARRRAEAGVAAATYAGGSCAGSGSMGTICARRV